MKTTLELLQAARNKTSPKSERQLAIDLGHAPTTLAMARTRGTLSPVIAGQLAELIGADVEHWIAVAAIEAAPRSRVTDHLRRTLYASAQS
ncbi:MAG TPA: hypothetical protein VNU71_16700 [Burkholderiaceae bacterium]|nr:hypothetical protein [Burkholderiaceae bacterium]